MMNSPLLDFSLFLSGNVAEFCKCNPGAVKEVDNNCGQYFNCSALSMFGTYVHECPYPELFDSNMLTCRQFTEVNCDNRTEPQAPCKYFILKFSILKQKTLIFY